MESSVERLKAELIACDYFDSCFLSKPRHDLIETIAFVKRQNRRKELQATLAQNEGQ